MSRPSNKGNPEQPIGGLNTEYLVTKQRRREEKLWVRMILLLVLEAGEVDSLKIFCPIMRMFLFSDGGGEYYFVCVHAESP